MRTSLLSVAGIVCLVTASAFAAEMVDNPAYQNWAKYKPGTSVTYKQEVTAGGMNMTMETTQTLASVDAEKAVVDLSVQNNMMPNMPVQKHSMSIPAKVEDDKAVSEGKLPPGMKGEVKQLADEKVEVSGKTYDCKVYQFTGEQQGQKMEGKTWTTKEVPGSLVKMETTGSGEQSMKMKMELTKAEVKQ